MENDPLVQEFRIEGLYGYRRVSMSASHSTTILIAKNGSGKTTLLGALDAFLRCQFGRLLNIEFERIVCRLRGVDEVLELRFSDIERLTAVPDTVEFFSLVRKYSIDPQSLVDFIENDFDPGGSVTGYDDEVFKKIVSKHEYSARDAKKACERIAESLKGRVPEVDHVRDRVRYAMQGMDVLYLPTYRRIELSLGENIDEPASRKRASVRSRLGLSKRGFFNAEIQFGLGDISERLNELNNQLLATSNQGYRQISAKIVNDLLDGTFERSGSEYNELPEREALTVFFSRIRQGGRYFFGMESIETPDVDKIYSQGATTATSNKFLTYFLSQLNEVIKASQDIEGSVEEFVRNCNRYLSARDESAEIRGDLHSRSGRVDVDEKRLKLNRLTLELSVISLAAKRRVPIDSLSSGEKQMISLFARLYLYPGSKIVLIDEPELSLSIDWQRRILMDVVNAPSCEQLVAITHSPFVFDNDLDPYAKSIDLYADPVRLAQTEIGNFFPEEVLGDE